MGSHNLHLTLKPAEWLSKTWQRLVVRELAVIPSLAGSTVCESSTQGLKSALKGLELRLRNGSSWNLVCSRGYRWRRPQNLR